MNEDNQNLENKIKKAKKPSVKVGHIQKLMRIYKPLLKATDKLQTELYSGQSPSNDFVRAHFDEIKELINYSAALGLACEKQANLLNQYAPAKQYLSGLAVKVNYDGKDSAGKKLRVLSTEWCQGLEKAIENAKIRDLNVKVAEMDVKNTEQRRIITEYETLLAEANQKLEEYRTNSAGHNSADRGNQNDRE